MPLTHSVMKSAAIKKFFCCIMFYVVFSLYALRHFKVGKMIK